MKKWSSVFVILVLGGAGVGAEQRGAPQAQNKEPMYHWRTVSEWIALTKDKDKVVRQDAAWALRLVRCEARIPSPVVEHALGHYESQEAAEEGTGHHGRPEAVSGLDQCQAAV